MHRENNARHRFCARVLLIVGGLTPSLWAQPKFVRGDLNLDGRVTFADAGYFVEAAYFQGPVPGCIKTADVNDNGVIDQPKPADLDRLLDFLFRTGSPPPAPFPLRGVDPTPDNLTCLDVELEPPGPPVNGYGFAWDGGLYLHRGQESTDIFLEITTAAPITGFSMACLVNRAVLNNLRVDFKGTIVPSDLQQDILDSPYFRFRVVQSSRPGFDLLLLGAIFAGDLTKPSPKQVAGPEIFRFLATQAPVRNARILRLLGDVPPAAPVTGARIDVLLPGIHEDLIQGSGLLGEFLARQEAIQVATDFGYTPILADAGEFFRADANGDACRDLSDAVHTLSYLFLGGAAPRCPDASDANDDGALDVSDATFTLSFLFSGGRAPPTAPFVDPSFCWWDLAPDGLGDCVYECRECR